jgi:undecaprenyl-diphosphatase
MKGLTLLGSTGMFLGITVDLVTGHRLAKFDYTVFTTLQKLRTDLSDEVMIVATELGSAIVAISVITAVSVVLAHKRCWRTLAYWLTAVSFAQALVWILKAMLERARPIAMYAGADQFSFPSGHAMSSIVLYGCLTFLLTHKKPPMIRFAVIVFSTVLVGLIGFSRLYLGAHWLSDVLASLSLGTAWAALLSMAYRRHVPSEQLPARTMAIAAMGALVLAGTAVAVTNHAADRARYVAHLPFSMIFPHA